MKPLSANDRRYLAAMAQDPGEASSTREVAERLGVTPDYANSYRERLIDRALISGQTRGVVEWAVPMLSDYVRDLCRTPDDADAWIRTGRTSHHSPPHAQEADDLGELGPKIQALRARRTREPDQGHSAPPADLTSRSGQAPDANRPSGRASGPPENPTGAQLHAPTWRPPQ